MEAEGRNGGNIEIRCGEELDADGVHVRYKLRCNCTYLEFWTLSGGRDVLEFFDYKAFRYVEVIGGGLALEPQHFAAVVRHYPMDDDNCSFSTSHARLDSIWRICSNAVNYGTQEQFMECPTREKGQYLGDNTIIAHSHMYLSGDYRLTRKALRDFALSVKAVCPGLLAVAPGSFMQEIADFSLQWPLQLLQYAKQNGDLEFALEMLPVAEGIAAYFRQYEREDGLLQDVKEGGSGNSGSASRCRSAKQSSMQPL
ncbi:family 78 glycoside hydrolase catalytic domain [Paenibacillus sedimenti]|nr:family 78 glycoside hydrolase catalytic domain [Paenibacillus sedimenti]